MKNYFEFGEFYVTDTGLLNHVDNSYDSTVFVNLHNLRIVLNVVRSLVGRPIRITSAYRNAVVNDAVGGVSNSLHLYGRAADITCDDMSKLLDICTTFLEYGIFEECIYYPDRNIIHVAI